MSSTLRDLFCDSNAVKIYPDDFDGETNVVFTDLIDRRQGHFSERRLVVMFRPGTYHNINFPVGYWTQVIGLGENPDQVKFTGRLGVYALPANTDNPGVGSLDTFWRSAENFQSDTSFVQNGMGQWCVPTVKHGDVLSSLTPDTTSGNFSTLHPLPDLAALFPENASDFKSSKGMLWAVSQAAPLRRVHIKDGNLHLSLGENFASGGFIGNVNIGGYILMGSQQQFCLRNCDFSAKIFAGAWSFVFIGCQSGPEGERTGKLVPWLGPKPMVISEPSTAARIEKPFICIGKNDEKVYLAIPQLQTQSHGSDMDTPQVLVEIDNIKNVRVFTPSDSFKTVQEAATSGAHIVLSPGIYKWDQTLSIHHHNQVLLGIGMATIQAPGNGRPCIHVSSHAEGVRLSGLSLEATVISKSMYEGSTLLQWGNADHTNSGNPHNPGVIHDLYCFVGGRSPHRTVQVQTMVKVYASYVIGDNVWLWRADHVKLVNDQERSNRPELSEYHLTTYGECRCDTGLEVYGDHVTFYGLAVEHTCRDLLVWHGRHGAVYFYQAELPYDVPGNAYKDVAGYRVHMSAFNHVGKGIGVYSYFRDNNDVKVDSVVAHHAYDGQYENIFSVWLNGYSGIRSIINGVGGDTSTPGRPFLVPSYGGRGFFSLYFWKGVWKNFFG